MSLIDVILPTYNHSGLLPRAMDAILDQELKDFTLIVINDGSTDKTKEVLKKYTDPRILKINNEINKGLPTTLNIGHRAGYSPFCTWVSSDNISYKKHLSSLYKHITVNNLDFVQGDYIVVYNGVKSERHTDEITSSWGFGNLCPSFLYKRIVWETYNYDENLPAVEDQKFYLQSFLHPFKFGHVKEYLVEYYVHQNSMTAQVHKNLEEHNKKTQQVYEQIIVPYLKRIKKL